MAIKIERFDISSATKDASNAPPKKQGLREWPIYTEDEDGRLTHSHTERVHESRECIGCHALCEKPDEDGKPTTFCTVLDEVVPGGEYVCPEHQTPGEHRFGLKRSGVPVDAPSPAGSSVAWLDALAWMEHVVKTDGEAALHTPENEIKFARMLLIAPDDYYDMLEKVAPGSAEQWHNWARGHVERHDHPQFFEALRQIGEAVDLHSRDAVHGNPEYSALFVQAFETAPPRYRAEAEAILAPAIPKATHVNSAGEPVYSPEQIAEKLGVPVEDIRAFVDEHIDPSRLYTGIAHPIQ
ncbi:hypothetical protein [Variovorax sp. dw_954]|uniref:hypothetical protein n=1 Tax=Variovorax sp. dw_954 TaxID=2720078 RepID=UPI001BD3306B|nr:hypothetical protein [Variovorax sp. dw_954]